MGNCVDVMDNDNVFAINNKHKPNFDYEHNIDDEIIKIEELINTNKKFNEIYDIEYILHKIDNANERLVCKN